MTTQAVREGAPSHDGVTWHSIDWAKCHREVRRLQARIVKATQEGRHGKVRALQWMLTHSFSGKALAVRRVTENKGGVTSGVDKQTWSTPEAKSQAVMTLKRHGYSPLPLRRIYIPKANGKLRPLGIPTIKDRAMQALYLMALEPIAETRADGGSHGFRKERSTADAIAHCFNSLTFKRSAEWILEGDIKGCFDNISHEWLLNHIPTDRMILTKWLKAGYMENRQLFPTEAGTPQGGIISPTLANMVLDGLEARLKAVFHKPRKIDGKWTKMLVNFVRYADDFIVTGRSKELLETEVKPLVEEFMRERGLALSPEKTKVTHIAEGFDFLGQNIRKYKGKMLITPSKANVKTFLEKVRITINRNKTVKQEYLIRELNPIIRGWTNYHRHIVAKRTFDKVDHEIWKALWRWAVRRHPNKGKRWVKDRYFPRIGSRNWVFSADTGARFPNRKKRYFSLVLAGDTPIRRHVMIQLEANPFNPQWEQYFEKREFFKILNHPKWKKRAINLWLDQGGKCPVCNQAIKEYDHGETHHIVQKSLGGKSIMDNLVLVHLNCHKLIHARQLTVVKPVPARGL